ncbi:hypothetical protein AB0A69_19650 [Streptomyces sp. NPDC045431]|uniref:hypothetical protein n=1 Tax=Streptomyces sp. NPDC045431 TaxID=3155613 RepID=UPI003405E121
MHFEAAVHIIGVLALPIGVVALITWMVVRATAGHPWARAAVLLALGTGLLYLWGLAGLFTFDRQEFCTLSRGQEFAPDETGPDSLLPLSAKCNASYDLVPGYVNPGLAVGAVGTVACVVLAVRQKVRQGRVTGDVAGATLDNG